MKRVNREKTCHGLLIALLSALGAWPGLPARAVDPVAPAEGVVRVASFNIWELSAEKLDRLDAEGRPSDPQLLAAAEVLRRVRPHVVLLNEIDYDSERDLVAVFSGRYLETPHPTLPPLSFAHRVYLETNTGVQSGFDFDRNGRIGDPEDAWGFGRYPGQYGMALLSTYPLDQRAIRTFRLLRWSSMPGAPIPDGRDGRPLWYSGEEARLMRLSSKSHWDVPVNLPGLRLHVLASHPTPPVFDGEEDRNGRRNHDEIRLWADYLSGGDAASYLVDDSGRRGGLAQDEAFVILGDLNADPVRDPAAYGRPAIAQLLEHPRGSDPEPKSTGAVPPSPSSYGGAYPGDPRLLTSGFGRIDYVLPSRGLRVVGSGVYLPEEDHPTRSLVAGDGRASDHFLVWVDIALPSAP